jgi:hypothetical protein
LGQAYYKGEEMITFMAGLFIGCFVGIILIALLSLARDQDAHCQLPKHLADDRARWERLKKDVK